jgi:hypothetical protein
MRKITLLRSIPLAACLGLVFFAGCSERTASISGKVVLPSQVKLDENDAVAIIFHPENDTGLVPNGIFSKTDNTFVAKDVPPGKYKISVMITAYPGKNADQHNAVLNKYINDPYGREATKLHCEITADSSQSVTIDAIKGTVTVTKG